MNFASSSGYPRIIHPVMNNVGYLYKPQKPL